MVEQYIISKFYEKETTLTPLEEFKQLAEKHHRMARGDFEPDFKLKQEEPMKPSIKEPQSPDFKNLLSHFDVGLNTLGRKYSQAQIQDTHSAEFKNYFIGAQVKEPENESTCTPNVQKRENSIEIKMK